MYSSQNAHFNPFLVWPQSSVEKLLRWSDVRPTKLLMYKVWRNSVSGNFIRILNKILSWTVPVLLILMEPWIKEPSFHFDFVKWRPSLKTLMNWYIILWFNTPIRRCRTKCKYFFTAVFRDEFLRINHFRMKSLASLYPFPRHSSVATIFLFISQA